MVKSRRVGISKLCTALLTCHCLALDHADARIVAHQRETAAQLREAAVLMQSKLDIDAPDPTKDFLKYGPSRTSSQLTIGTAKNVAGGRGMEFSGLLATEAAYYENKNSFLSMLPTIPFNPHNYVFIESTANGKEGVGEVFFNQYELAVAEQGDFVAFFSGPQEDPDCVVDDDTTKRYMKIPMGDAYEREERDITHRFKLNNNQLAWRRRKYFDECNADLHKLHAEYPYYWEQAFVGTGYPVFTVEELNRAEDTVKLAGKGMRGDLLRDKDRIRFTAKSEGPFTIWEPPQEGHEYFIGADAARGEKTGDFSAAVVWDGHTGKQVASFMYRAGVETFANMLDMLGRYYGSLTPTKQAMMNIEISCNLGNTVQQRMRDDYHYGNFYRWRGKDDRLVRNVLRTPPMGWETTSKTREMLVHHYRISLMDGDLRVSDQRLYSQMLNCEREFGQRWDVTQGHDDLLMAAMIGWIARIQWAPPPLGVARVGGQSTAPITNGAIPGNKTFEDLENFSPVLENHRQKMMEQYQRIGERTKVIVNEPEYFQEERRM